MTWCILLLLYRDVIIVLAFTTCHRTHHTRKSIENTEKNPYLFSYLLYFYIFILLRRNASPKKKTRCSSSSSSRIFFETHPKTTGLLHIASFSAIDFPLLRFFSLLFVVSKHFFGEKTNKKHAASLFQRGYDSRRERESEAGERGAIAREANGTSSFDFFFSLNSLFITFC